MHPHRSVLAKVLDGRDDVEPDFSILPVQPSDRFLLCSDGLSAVVRPEAIEQAMASSGTPEAAVQELISLALRSDSPRLASKLKTYPRRLRTGGRSAPEPVTHA